MNFWRQSPLCVILMLMLSVSSSGGISTCVKDNLCVFSYVQIEFGKYFYVQSVTNAFLVLFAEWTAETFSKQSIVNRCSILILSLTAFEPLTFGVGSDHSTNWSTATETNFFQKHTSWCSRLIISEYFWIKSSVVVPDSVSFVSVITNIKTTIQNPIRPIVT